MVLPLNCTFSSETPRQYAELQSYVGFFENSSLGPRSGAVFAGFGDTTGPKLGDKIPKKWANCFPPKCRPFLDLIFHVDFDFAINHDLIP